MESRPCQRASVSSRRHLSSGCLLVHVFHARARVPSSCVVNTRFTHVANLLPCIPFRSAYPAVQRLQSARAFYKHQSIRSSMVLGINARILANGLLPFATNAGDLFCNIEVTAGNVQDTRYFVRDGQQAGSWVSRCDGAPICRRCNSNGGCCAK